MLSPLAPRFRLNAVTKLARKGTVKEIMHSDDFVLVILRTNNLREVFKTDSDFD